MVKVAKNLWLITIEKQFYDHNNNMVLKLIKALATDITTNAKIKLQT